MRHGAVDHAAERAAIDHDVVQGKGLLACSVVSFQRHREQGASLLDVMALEHVGQRRRHAGERDVRQESQPALVHADQGNVEGRELSTESQHRAVAADDDREVGMLAKFGCRDGCGTCNGCILGRLGVQHDAMAPRRQECAEPRERCGDGGRGAPADEGDARKAGGGHAAIKPQGPLVPTRPSGRRAVRYCKVCLIEWNGCWKRAPSTS